MKYEFYFADLKVTIVLEADAEDVFAKLTDNEYLSLQQIIYHGLMTFLNTRALYLTDRVIDKKYLECAEHKCQCTCHGG